MHHQSVLLTSTMLFFEVDNYLETVCITIFAHLAPCFHSFQLQETVQPFHLLSNFFKYQRLRMFFFSVLRVYCHEKELITFLYNTMGTLCVVKQAI